MQTQVFVESVEVLILPMSEMEKKWISFERKKY